MMLVIHIVGGTVALLAGGAALALGKGNPLHARIGTAFFTSMLVMCASAVVLGVLAPERGTATIGAFTAYLVATSWATARRRDGQAGSFEIAAFLSASGLTVLLGTFIYLAWQDANGRLDSLPASAHYPFVFLAGLSALLDLNWLLRRTLKPRQRIARHLWRMTAALAIAAFSFFLGQQDEMPAALRGSPVMLVPPLATLAAMAYWIIKVRFGKAMRPKFPAQSAAEPA
jgi:hypothetical protein